MRKLILIVLILTLGISCKESKSESDKKQNEVSIIPAELNGFSMEQIKNIHQYMNVDRWNNGGDIGTRMGTDYSKQPPLKTVALDFRLAPKGHHMLINLT